MLCENCGKEIDGTYGSGRFCGPKCARGFSTKGKRAEINLKTAQTLQGRKTGRDTWKYVCEKCDKKFRKQTSLAAHRLHCVFGFVISNESVEVRNAAVEKYWQEKHQKELELWKLGKFKPTSSKTKTLLIFERGLKCQKCGWAGVNPVSNTIPIELEHIDGDCYNNKYENCQLLCPNCHALTPTYKALNAGGGLGRKFYKVVSKWAKEQGIKGIFDSNRTTAP
jgi:hypothetical protein